MPDVFETFAHRVDDGADTSETIEPARVAVGASISLGLMVLTGIAFVLGFWTGTQNEHDLAYDHLVWEGIIKVGFATLCGLLAAAVVLALAMIAIGVPWVRRQRDARRR
ncbi:hypothetical protein N802_05745 [Knoellia sinensis KCTC 19936]|uniref:Uncharacterized protein n=2 Tax=Knoellia TaxID=136099 RepID=A0A0A0J2I8_9MICO|nr:hypothetical protein N802_05745 [Knoellia sinensis KCTC 19936]